MGFGKIAIIFIMVSLFAVTVVGMASMMEKDKPTDSYYTNPNNTISGSVQLGSQVFSVTSSLMIPIVGIVGILVLLGGFFILSRKW